MKRIRDWSKEDDARLIELLKEGGRSYPQIGAILKRTGHSVNSRIQRLGVAHLHTPATRVGIGEKVIAMAKQGHEPQEIAAALGYSNANTVETILRRAGLMTSKPEAAGYAYARYNWDKARKAARDALNAL